MKKRNLLISMLAVFSMLTACGQTATDPNPVNPPSGDTEGEGEGEGGEGEKGGEAIPVTKVEFEVSSLSLEVGDTEFLDYKVYPENATDKSVTFSSSNQSVATISETGMMRALSAGQTTLTVFSADKKCTGTAILTVVAKPDGEEEEPINVPVTGVHFTKTPLVLKEGESNTASVTISPTNATNKNITFSSSDPTVASVTSPGGLVTGVKEGTATITVTTVDGSYKATLTVKVEAAPTEPGGDDEEEPLPEINYVKVFAPSEYTTVYAWLGSGGTATKIVGDWPGTTLQTYDEDWKTYDFLDYTSLNLIFSINGNSQTGDLSVSKAGYYWYSGGTLVDTKPKIDPYIPTTDIPQGNYELVDEAANAEALPAVKNYNKGKVINKYNGSRTDFRDESIYFAMTTRFYDGDKSNNTKCWDGKNNAADDPAWRGDFKGLIEKMDYIKALGFTAIWITPVVKNASGYDYHGYHAINFKEVDPRYLSEDVSFQDVINTAHAKDMKIILDVVFNHTGNFGEENLFPMFYYDSTNNTTVKGIIRNPNSGLLDSSYDSLNGGAQYNKRIDTMKNERDVYNIYHHEKSMAYEQYIEQTGQMAGDCVDLNTENPTVANYIVDAYGEFIRMGVDAFRIDTMKHISRLTFNNYIWPGLYAIAKKCGNTNFYMFGEVCTRVREVWNHGQACDSAPFYTWKESKQYSWGTREVNEASTKENWIDNANTNQPTSQNAYLNGLNYHAPDYSKSSNVGVIDFPMHWNFQHARDAFGVAVRNDQFYNDATFNVTYVDSHDYGPDGAEKIRYNEGTDAWKENMSLLFTFRGVPCIYYGSEIEFQKGKTIDEGPNLALKDSGRAYYGDNLEGTVTATGFGTYTANGTVNSTLSSTLSKHLQQLNKIRLNVPALRRGQYTTSNVSGDGGMAFTRRYSAQGVDSIALVTISGNATFNNLPGGTYVDQISGKSISVGNGGSLTATVGGQGNLAIFVRQ